MQKKIIAVSCPANNILLKIQTIKSIDFQFETVHDHKFVLLLEPIPILILFFLLNIKQCLRNQPMFAEDEMYVCSHCEKTYSSQGTLQVHMAEVHSSAKPYQCDLCPRSYKYKKSLRIHRTKHQGMVQNNPYLSVFIY